MNTLDMYKIAENENIEIFNYNWSNTKARIFEVDNNYYIGLDNNQIYNSIEEKQILAEECGHYFCNALYYLNDNSIIKRKCEYRARKWAYSVLVPFHILKEKIKQGMDLYELADFFDVDVSYMNNCIDFYKDKYGVFC